METNMANEETNGENQSIPLNDKEMPSASVLGGGGNSHQPQGVQDANQREAYNDSPEEPRDDDDNPNVSFLPSSGQPSYEQTGQSSPGRSRELDADLDADNDIEDSRRLSFLGPVVCLIVVIPVVWVLRLFLPLVQAFAGSTGGQKVVYGCMLALPVILIAVAIVWLIRVFSSLPAGVDCWYSPDYREKRALRKKLIRRYLNGFKTDKNLYRLIGEDAQKKLELLYQGGDVDNIDGWIKDYKEFQEALKHRAEKERDKYAKAIAVATMASPKFKLDAMVTLFFSTLMLLSIARIFNKRTTRIGAFRLACSWSLNLFLSSQLQGWGRKIGQIAGTGVEIATKMSPISPVAELAGEVVERAVGMGIEGGANYKLAKSLGDKAIKYFAAVKGLEDVV